MEENSQKYVIFVSCFAHIKTDSRAEEEEGTEQEIDFDDWISNEAQTKE